MMKNVLSSLFIALLLVFSGLNSVSAVLGDPEVTNLVFNPISASGLPGETINANFNVYNNDITAKTINIILLNLKHTDITKTDTIVVGNPSLSSVSLNAGASTTAPITFSIAIPASKPYLAAGQYKGTIKLVNSQDPNDLVLHDYYITVLAKKSLDVLAYSATTPLSLLGQEGATATKTFSVKNDGNDNINLGSNSFSLGTNPSLSDGTRTITLGFSSNKTTLLPGETATVTLSAVIPSNTEFNTYYADVVVTDGTATDSFRTNIVVEPEVCKYGIRGDGVDNTETLKIDINDPDSGDSYKPGEKITVDVNVANDNNEEMDVAVVAILYNLDKSEEVEKSEEVTESIDEGEDTDFNLEITVPEDSDLDDEDKYMIYVKAYDDENGADKNCNYEGIEVDIEREEHDTIIKEVTVNPTSAKCGELVEVEVKVENKGTRDEDGAYIKLVNPSLGLNLKSAEFDLEAYDEDDNNVVERFTFIVPEDSDEKDHSLETVVYFDDGDGKDSEFVTFSVNACSVEPVVPEYQASLSVGQATRDGNSLSVPVEVKNDGTNRGTFSLEVANAGSWADPVSAMELTLDAGQSSTVYFYLNLKEGMTGRQSATVNLKADGIVVKSQSISVDLTTEETTKENGNWITGAFSGLFEDGKNSDVFWIIGDIVLVIIAIFFIKLLFTRRK